MTHTVYLPFQLLVGVDRGLSCKVVVVADIGKTVLTAVFRIGSLVQQVLQHLPLQRFAVGQVSFQCPHTGYEDMSY